MRRRFVVLSVLGLALSIAAPATGQNLESFHLKVTGVAELLASTCPWESIPEPESECVDTFVLFAQEAPPRLHPRRVPWYVLVYEVRYIFHDEDSFTFLHERFGVLEDPAGSMDTVHLRTASVAGSVPMDDGSTYDLDLEWDLSNQAFHVSGNDGPTNNDVVPWGSHLVDDCLTQNYHAHQTWRRGGTDTISGTLDGTDVDELLIPSDEPFLARGVFTIVISSHGDCL